ncbi:type II toxin-antitoxin system HicA family toxin [Serratia sp. BNK-17]|uniref:type II toxin-antitoxin system HicA family toxin n=1 Tax=Serratia sp. BNK-17 TaxID=3376154 RepID=UPI003B437184
MSSAELIRKLKKEGWVLDRVKGSHHTFVKEGREDIITVPHPEKDLATGTLQRILKQLKQ